LISIFQEWFSHWPESWLDYDEAPTNSVLACAWLLAAAGLAAIAIDLGGVAHAVVDPKALAPAVVLVVLTIKWLAFDGKLRMALVIVADVIASIGAAVALCGAFGVPPDAGARWVKAFEMLTLLIAPLLYPGSWAVLSWYADLQSSCARRVRGARDVLSGEAAPTDWLAKVISVGDGVAEVELKSGTVTKTALAEATILDRRPRPEQVYLLRNAQLAEDASGPAQGDYRSRKRALRLLGADTCECVTIGKIQSVSFFSEIAVASLMLLLQHALLAGAALLLAPAF
jgi:hypothetical protein